MIKGIIFDLDGVLIDAKEWHYEALNRVLRQFKSEMTREEHLNIYDGLPTRKKLEIMSEKKNLPPQLHETIVEWKQRFTMELIERYCEPFPQHERALSELKKAGYKLAVASNSIRRTVEVTLQKARLAQYMDFMLSNEDVKQPKPHPEIYQKAIQMMGFKPEECVIVEDNINGIKAAEAAGGQLLIVDTIQDVSLENILKKIASVTT